MYRLVDLDEDTFVEGYSYYNNAGVLERVSTVCADAAEIHDSAGGSVEIYYEDIPLLIKALTCAYNDWKRNNET